MKIVIVGGSSSLGLALQAYLSSENEVISAGRKNCDVFIDLCEESDQLKLPDKVDVLIHTAADFGGNTSDKMEQALKINTIGTLKLLEAASNAEIKHFIFISSIFVLLEPESPQYGIYSISKKYAEDVARYFVATKSKMALTILRPSQIYGDSDSFRKHQPFFYQLIDKVEKGEEISIYGSNDPKRNYIHIDDLVAIISKVIQNKTTGTFNCMYPENTSFTQIVSAAKKAFNSNSSIKFLRERDDIPNNIFKMELRLYDIINKYPEISILDGMNRLRNYRSITND